MFALPLLVLACAPRADDADDGAQPPDSGGTPIQGDTSGDTSGDSGDPCAGVPLVNYATFGQGFMSTHCQGCHASTTANRYGAPEDVVFDTVEQVWEWAPLILVMAVGKEPDMPPAGGVTEDDQTRLRWWLDCGEPGT